MAQPIIFTNALILINGVDLTSNANKVTVVDDRARVDVTTLNLLYTAETKGLGSASITIDVFQSVVAGSVHATLQPLLGSTTAVAVEIRAINAARSVNNLTVLLASALMFTYNAIDGAVGDALALTAEFGNAPGGAGITYPTS